MYGPNVEIMWPILFRVAGHPKYDLLDKRIMAGLCGVIRHESAHRFWPIHEFGGPQQWARYGRAPNGTYYAGRGLIQTTWAANYGRVQNYLRDEFGIVVDLLGDPDIMIGNPELAAHAACIYWVTHGGYRLVAKACEREDWGEVIRLVWGAKIPGNPDYDKYLREVQFTTRTLLSLG